MVIFLLLYMVIYCLCKINGRQGANMNYYNEIKENLLKCEMYDRTKDFSKTKIEY